MSVRGQLVKSYGYDAAFFAPSASERRGAATTFLHSGLKNADAQFGPAQSLTASRAYDAFGNVLSSSGSWQGPFGYQEDATGLMLLGHRLYDPSTGRFLTRGPIKDGRNWYVYCGNDPLVFYDSDGLQRKQRHRPPLRQWIKDQWDGIVGFFRGLGGDVGQIVVEGCDMLKAAGTMRLVPFASAISDIEEHGVQTYRRLHQMRSDTANLTMSSGRFDDLAADGTHRYPGFGLPDWPVLVHPVFCEAIHGVS